MFRLIPYRHRLMSAEERVTSWLVCLFSNEVKGSLPQKHLKANTRDFARIKNFHFGICRFPLVSSKDLGNMCLPINVDPNETASNY